MDCPELLECSFMENSVGPKRAKRYTCVLEAVTGVIGHAKPCIIIVIHVLVIVWFVCMYGRIIHEL